MYISKLSKKLLDHNLRNVCSDGVQENCGLPSHYIAKKLSATSAENIKSSLMKMIASSRPSLTGREKLSVPGKMTLPMLLRGMPIKRQGRCPKKDKRIKKNGSLMKQRRFDSLLTHTTPVGSSVPLKWFVDPALRDSGLQEGKMEHYHESWRGYSIGRNILRNCNTPVDEDVFQEVP